MTDLAVAKSKAFEPRRWAPWLGALCSIAGLLWLLRNVDLQRFLAILAGADVRFLALLPLSLFGEHLLRAWKWRRLAMPLRRIGTLRLLGAMLAGHLVALLAPFGAGTAMRTWLVAQWENLRFSAVLATVVLDRATDGLVLAGLVPVALLSVALADRAGILQTGLALAGVGAFGLCILVLLLLAWYRREAGDPGGWMLRFVSHLPSRPAAAVRRTLATFAEGIVWPERSRGMAAVFGIAAARVLVGTSHFLWAGLAVGVMLRPAEYLFLVVFLTFFMVVGYVARTAGTFLLAAMFALGLLGVADEQALAIALAVEGFSLLIIGVFGVLSLWGQSMRSGDARATAAPGAD